jgi:hypothetical protein
MATSIILITVATLLQAHLPGLAFELQAHPLVFGF